MTLINKYPPDREKGKAFGEKGGQRGGGGISRAETRPPPPQRQRWAEGPSEGEGSQQMSLKPIAAPR